MIIVKLGGSLYSNPLLINWVNRLASINNRTIIIVPGGGPFADQVRKASRDWSINDDVAHNMALLAMQQFACLIGGLNNNIVELSSIAAVQDDLRTYIWLPHNDIINNCEYPKDWQTTSDSLSLWLAKSVSAEKLILIKSAELEGKSNAQIILSDIVDEYFVQASDEYTGDIQFYHASHYANLEGI